MNKSPEKTNFFEHLKKQKWVIPVLIIIFLILVGSMLFLSEDSALAPFIYQKF